ncbi:aspartic proteinase 39-like [Cicer arietinum]|uniref:aspartic proteinase 39-like n=1 Tax=Cicer arietinum TaxID=3827 RepID=UPI00032A8BE7
MNFYINQMFLACCLTILVVPKMFTRYLSLNRVVMCNHRVEMETLRAHNRARNSKILHGVVHFPVQGNSMMCTTIVKLGSTPSEYIVLIDKGSDILLISCNQCDNCPQSNGLGFKFNFFNTVSSSMAALIHCSDYLCPFGVQVSVQFLGYDEFIHDRVSSLLGPSMPFRGSRGCTHIDWGLIETQTTFDGIFGFSPSSRSVVYQLSACEIIPNAFSHCLKGDGSGGDILALGAVVEPNIVLKDKNVVYDLTNQQIGWMNYNCSMCVDVNVTLSKDKNNNPRANRSSFIFSSELGILST